MGGKLALASSELGLVSSFPVSMFVMPYWYTNFSLLCFHITVQVDGGFSDSNKK